MRNDMFEVIIERPRINCRGGKKGRREERTERAFDRAPKQLGMSRGRGTKYLNENLAPLRRFLARHAGRPWNAVRSEMNAVLSMRSAVQKHVLDHVRDFVEENPIMIDGKPFRHAAWGGEHRPLECHPRWPKFYVCPRTGLLRMAPLIRRKKPPSAPSESTMDAGRGMGQ